MRLVTPTRTPGVVELNYMWLPTWLGINSMMKAQIEERVGPLLKGRDMDEAVLEEAHEAVIDFLEEKFANIKGLREYLDGLKFVQVE